MTITTTHNNYKIPHDGQPNWGDEIIAAWKDLDGDMRGITDAGVIKDIGEFGELESDNIHTTTGEAYSTEAYVDSTAQTTAESVANETVNQSPITPVSVDTGDITATDVNADDLAVDNIDGDEITLNIDEPVSMGDFHESMVKVGNYSTKTDPSLVELLNTGMYVDDGEVWGLSTNITNDNSTETNFFGVRSRVHTRSTNHSQNIAFLGRVIQEDGTDGELPPSAGLYLDSRGSTVRPCGCIIDDGLSIWENGIVLNGDYSDTVIRHDNWKLYPTGNVVRDGGINVPYKTVTDSYTVQTTDEVIGIDTATAGGFAVTLVTPSEGKKYTFVDEVGNCSLNTCTIRTADTETINGATDYTLNEDYESITVVGTGTDWVIV